MDGADVAPFIDRPAICVTRPRIHAWLIRPIKVAASVPSVLDGSR